MHLSNAHAIHNPSEIVLGTLDDRATAHLSLSWLPKAQAVETKFDLAS
jgi:hypothetical protein